MEVRWQLEEAVKEAFPSRERLRMVLRRRLDENLEDMASDGPLGEVVFQVVEHLERHGRVAAMVRAFYPEVPDPQAARWRELAGALGVELDGRKILLRPGPPGPEIDLRIVRLRLFVLLAVAVSGFGGVLWGAKVLPVGMGWLGWLTPFFVVGAAIVLPPPRAKARATIALTVTFCALVVAYVTSCVRVAYSEGTRTFLVGFGSLDRERPSCKCGPADETPAACLRRNPEPEPCWGRTSVVFGEIAFSLLLLACAGLTGRVIAIGAVREVG